MNSLVESPGAWVRKSGWLRPSVTTGTSFNVTCPLGVVVVVEVVVVGPVVSARAR